MHLFGSDQLIEDVKIVALIYQREPPADYRSQSLNYGLFVNCILGSWFFLPFHLLLWQLHQLSRPVSETRIYSRLDCTSNSNHCFHHNTAHAPENDFTFN